MANNVCQVCGGEMKKQGDCYICEKCGNKSEQILAKTLKISTLQTRELGVNATVQTDITETQTLSLIDTYMKAGEWEEAKKLVEDILRNNPACEEALWKQILIENKAVNNEAFSAKINSVSQTVLQRVDKIINCATPAFATQILDILYDCRKTATDELYCAVLKIILPYEYQNRAKNIKEAFQWAIDKTKIQTFELLLTTLQESDVDAYILYNRRYVDKSSSNAEKKKCIDRILSVDEGDIETRRKLLFIQLEENEPSTTVLKTFETTLKYTHDNHKEIKSVLFWLGENLNSLDDCALVKQALRYSTDDISVWKYELMNLSKKMIGLGYFEEAEYLCKLILTFAPSEAEVYWNLCLIKVRATTEENIKKSEILLKQVPEYTKYLTLVEENRRLECLSLAKEQEQFLANQKAEQEKLLAEKKKKKKLRNMMMIAVASVVTIGCAIGATVAMDAKSRGYCQLELSNDGYYIVTKYTGKKEKLEIPSEYKGKPIRKIRYYAFEDCDSLTSVVIPNSVTEIGSSAFYKCDSLTEMTIPFVGATKDGTSNTHFGYIFGVSSYLDNDDYVPTSLKKVTILDGATSIGSSAFYNCNSLTEIAIPDSVTTIGSSAFKDCDRLTSITVSENNVNYQSIDGNLYSKDGKTFIQYAIGKTDTSFTIPDSVTTIGSSAFRYCDSLTSVVIPNSVTTIGEDAFYNCNRLTSVVIPDSVTTIGDYAFYNCNSLTSVVIGDSVTTIGFGAFFGCDRLTSVVIPDSVTTIGSSAFEDCSSLKSVMIPDGVTSIGKSTFYNCDSLTEMTIPFVGATKDGTSNTHFGYIFGASSYSDNVDYVPASLKKVTILDGATTIGSSVFNSCTSLTEIVIPDSVTEIGEFAFFYCNSLTSVVIPDSVTSIGESAFSLCDRLTSVTIGNSVTTIGEDAFFGCDSLTSVVIPNSVTTIGDGAFSFCDNLSSVVIPNGVTTIGNGAFYNCSSLTSVVIPNSVTSIGYEAFYDCDNLTIYCEAKRKPSGWSRYWDDGVYNPVVWGYTEE